ncbi:PAS domain-containing protein [Pseudoalteromonas sp. SS15]|uniref:PAS domain-containing protein n=1 Tax=Pseudoalteromonas sp. SS15 TaxID=3139393 RepID=UPI003BA93E29
MAEIILPENEIIVSKTDTHSHITYCNKLFIEISGYTEQELLGQPHNIIRHPDMPKAVYLSLWNTIGAEDEFFGLVKNRCKNGDFYWAFANITASYDVNGQVMGYYSVRRKPSPALIQLIEPIYSHMLEVEAKTSNKQDAMQSSWQFLESQLDGLGEDYVATLLQFNQKAN